MTQPPDESEGEHVSSGIVDATCGVELEETLPSEGIDPDDWDAGRTGSR